ncbi:MAG: hypothetical protein JWP97_4648, partial [Labilithrix sp.]|nr:hypothetical protein [Labilithrix sp.]
MPGVLGALPSGSARAGTLAIAAPGGE